MKLKRTNIESRLSGARTASVDETRLLEEVYEILRKDEAQEQRISENLKGGKNPGGNAFDFELLDTSKIYHLDQIRKTCINYRLRFLDIRYFKGEVPREGISKIKALEKDHGIEIKGFKLMAPSRLFKLEDKDDPLLFAPIGNGYYYLIHTWGNDLHPLRKMLVWPFKNVINLAAIVVLVSMLATLMVPSGLFSKSGTAAEFWIIFFFMFKSIAAVVIFYGFALGKNFNPAIWNSKYFNA
ncbi:hypothetical protein [Zeaxanthinibacter enoshimensis]|uniref:Uncharacterized protein n=1 Tax=Zeaxanthinibacter enoshimensis TaxID=392009 RepID=A0A4R6TNS2_9FLAO|nr:hypothetical protein [Zeaxanthinibacter enoshimensis]TDQ31588.1 hypothetical protein CLV82_2296 [Zeaxanthinibacter enoshimensis]